MIILIIHVTIVMSITIFLSFNLFSIPFSLSPFAKSPLFNINDTLTSLLPASKLDINTDHETISTNT